MLKNISSHRRDVGTDAGGDDDVGEHEKKSENLEVNDVSVWMDGAKYANVERMQIRCCVRVQMGARMRT